MTSLDTTSDRLDIADLLALYSTALDTKQWDLLDEVFTPDAVCDYGSLGNPANRDEIKALIRRTLEPLDFTQHFIGNVVVKVDGDKAHTDLYLIAQHIRAGAAGGESYMMGARYADDVVRTPEGWRISHREIIRGWATGNREVISRPQGN
jgi:SnoaL-like domain